MPAPAKLRGLRRATRLNNAVRSVKMLRPICSNEQRTGCQDGDQVPRDWYLDCPHDPYIGSRTTTTVVKQYEDGQDGERIVVGEEVTTTERPWPNFVPVIVMTRVNSGQGVEKARAKGYIMPSELRSPAYPNGIADCCDFNECYWQEVTQYANGSYCRKVEAALVYESERGQSIEVHNMEKRQEQVDAVMAKVR